jgi:gas vesicle protein
VEARWAFLTGLGIGAAMALLFAPQSGKKTQKLVSEKVRKGLDQASVARKHVGAEIKDWAEKGKEQFAESFGKETGT